MLRKSLAVLVATLLPLQAQAQIFGWSGGPTEYRPEPYAANASKMPPQMALACYALYIAIEGHKGELFIAEDEHKALKAAFYKRVEAAIRESGQPGDVASLVRPHVDQWRANWNALAAIDQRKVCETTADAGMVALRADPAAKEAMTCWSVVANTRPDDPQTTFLQTDLAVAMVTFRVPYTVRDNAFARAKRDAAEALEGPQAAAIEQQYAGCGTRVRPALRKAAWPTDRWGVNDIYGRFKYIRDDLARGLGGEPPPQIVRQDMWKMSEASWTKWIASPDAGDAAICINYYPYRDAAKPANGWTFMDLGLKLANDAGVTGDEAYVVLTSAAWKIDLDVNSYSIEPGAACEAWGKAMAARLGGTFHMAKRPF